MADYGQIIILNGAPRAGKSSVAAAIQESFDGVWVNIGADSQIASLPEKFRPGIGLRPGGERPDLEPLVCALFAALYASIAAHSRLGINVIADVGHHEAYSRPLHILRDCSRLLTGLPSLFVGVRCPVEEILQRRERANAAGEGQYLTSMPGGAIPEPVLLWQREAHLPGIYDLEADTSALSPQACAVLIKEKIGGARTASPSLSALAQ